jgi:tetratricopeptide (TPR) repeat protein
MSPQKRRLNQENQPVIGKREIRVFISSTFRDMMRERDLLVKQVFPELRRKCAGRFVTFTEVDLRWGITEEQAAEGQVLPLCLAEIERSRPYFIGLLGERYGWIPDTIRPEVIEREPWLKEHVHCRTSVTELEILHGILNNPKMMSLAFFYFRNPDYVNNPSLSPEVRREMIERDLPADIEKYGKTEAARRTEERKSKLAALKQRIRDSELPLIETYATPEALAEIVRTQFDALIDRLYPEEQAPDLLAQERMAHEAFAKSKLFACINRPAHLAALNSFISPPEHGGKGIVVTGESGCGKTALLAAWARDWTAAHPGDFLFQHYFGATPDSASPGGFLQRLLGELKSRFDISEDIPTDPEKLRDTLLLWLAQAAGQGRVLLVLDGLSQVQGGEAERRLNFLPPHIPPNVAVLASALPGPALDTLRGWGWIEHGLPPAGETEVDAMIGEYLKIHARTLEPALRRQLATAPGASNPLFLRTVLEELRQFGSFERLPQRVAHYLGADNPKALFLRVISRWQEDFDGKDPEKDRLRIGLVRRALTHLWAARQGLSEPEWLDLLGADVEPLSGNSTIQRPEPAMRHSTLPRALWTPLFWALEPHLSQSAGLYVFSHDFLRQAIEEEFLPGLDARRSARLAIIDYFERHPNQSQMTPRKAAEWPYQLHSVKAWDRLEYCLTDIPLFLALYNDKTKWELTGYWKPLRFRGRDIAACYTAAHRRWIAEPANVQDHYVSTHMGLFLVDNGLHQAAEPLLYRALETRERLLGPVHPLTINSVSSFALLLERKGDYSGAEPLFRRALELSEQVLGAEHSSTLTTVNNLAALLRRKGEYLAAEELLRRALETSERVLGPEHPDTLLSVSNLAALLESKGDYAGAEQLCHRALEGCERIMGPEHPNTLTTGNNLAALLHRKGDYAAAEALLRRVLEGCERIMGPEHPNTLTSVNNLAALLKSKGDYSGAEPLFHRVLEGCERIRGLEHPDTLAGVNNLAELLRSKGDNEGAEPLFRRALELSERVQGPVHPDTIQIMNNLFVLLAQKGDAAGVEELCRWTMVGYERVLGPEHPSTLISMCNLAELIQSRGDTAGAEALFRRVMEIRERVLGPDHLDTLKCINRLAGLLERMGDTAGVEALYRRLFEASERVHGSEHPETLTGMCNLALLLYRKGDYAGAEPLYHRVLKGLLKISAATQQTHPNLELSIANYSRCLEELGHSPAEIRKSLETMMLSFGISPVGNTGLVKGLPSPKLSAAIEQLIRDPSKGEEIFTQLEREDPVLLAELIQWIGSQS